MKEVKGVLNELFKKDVDSIMNGIIGGGIFFICSLGMVVMFAAPIAQDMLFFPQLIWIPIIISALLLVGAPVASSNMYMTITVTAGMWYAFSWLPALAYFLVVTAGCVLVAKYGFFEICESVKTRVINMCLFWRIYA